MAVVTGGAAKTRKETQELACPFRRKSAVGESRPARTMPRMIASVAPAC